MIMTYSAFEEFLNDMGEYELYDYYQVPPDSLIGTYLKQNDPSEFRRLMGEYKWSLTGPTPEYSIRKSG